VIQLAAYAAVVAAGEPLGDSTSVLLTYGPLGVIFALAVAAGRVVWKRFDGLLTAATARAEAAEARNDVLVSRLMDQAAQSLPVLTRATDVMIRLAEELDRTRRDQR
jgi:hypothetical protein